MWFHELARARDRSNHVLSQSPTGLTLQELKMHHEFMMPSGGFDFLASLSLTLRATSFRRCARLSVRRQRVVHFLHLLRLTGFVLSSNLIPLAPLGSTYLLLLLLAHPGSSWLLLAPPCSFLLAHPSSSCLLGSMRKEWSGSGQEGP